MRLGYVRTVTTSGQRTLLTVAIDRELYPDVVLLHPLNVRQQVNEGDRVKVMQEGENSDALYAELFEVARPVTPTLELLGDQVLVRAPDGTAVPLMTKADGEAIADHIDQHQHAGLLGGTGSVAALTSPPTKSVAGTPIDESPQPEGTTVLMAQ